MKRVRFTRHGWRITLVREGRRQWRNYVAGPPGIGGLSMSHETEPFAWALAGALAAVRERR